MADNSGTCEKCKNKFVLVAGKPWHKAGFCSQDCQTGDVAPREFSRQPKHKPDAVLKAPGNMGGRVIKAFPNLSAAKSNVEGALLCCHDGYAREDQIFYLLESNNVDHPTLLVGELDAHLVRPA